MRPLSAVCNSHAALLFLALVGVGIILTGTSKYGVGLSPDSIHYIFAARSILSDHSILAFGGSPLVSWPPLYPASLAGLGVLGIEPLTGARYFNAVVFGLIVLSSGHLFRNYLRSSALVILGTVLILVSVVLFRVSIMAWTESLFILLTIWFLIYLSKFLTKQRFIFLLMVAVLAGFASLQRYMGITLVLTGLISIVLIHRRSLGYRSACISFFGVVSTIPVALWLARNYWLTSNLIIDRIPPSTNLLDNIGYIVNTISSWLLPVQYIPMQPAKVVLLALSFAVIAGLACVALKARLGRPSGRKELPLAPFAIFVGVYTLCLITAANMDAFIRIDDRFLSPIYVFVFLFGLLGVERLATGTVLKAYLSRYAHRFWLVLGLLVVCVGLFFNEWIVVRLVSTGGLSGGVQDTPHLGPAAWSHLLANGLISTTGSIQTPFRVMIWIFNLASVIFGILILVFRRKSWILLFFISGISVLWLMYPLSQSYFSVSNKAESGAGGYHLAHFRESPLIDHIRNNPLEGSVYSNTDNVLYILTYGTGTPSPLSIELIYENAYITQAEVERINTVPNLRRPKSWVNKESFDNDKYLVWIGATPFESSLDYSRMSSKLTFLEVAKFPNGAIYLIR